MASDCWLCGQAVTDPPEVIGQYVAGQTRLAHRRCARVLGELELSLQLPPDPGEPDAVYRGPPDR